MQSLHEPSAVADVKGCSILRKKVFEPSLKEQDRLQFVLCANPTKRLAKERCRVPIIDEDQLVEWLQKKLEKAATLGKSEIVDKRNLYFRKAGKAGKVVTATFSGQISVNDPTQMRSILENGIGSAKAFGCGLMLVRRI
jgi:CRISPR system Cascade subunit CasE